MKQNKVFHIVAILAFLAIFSLGIYGILYLNRVEINGDITERDSEKHKVSIIVKSTTSDFWHSVLSGASAAATEYNLDISFSGPDNEEDYETQNEFIYQAIEEETEIIIFSAVDYNANAEAINAAADAGIKIIIIDSDVNSDKISCRISTDNYQAGRMAGEAALASQEEELRIGIVNFDKNSANGQQREQGFRDVVEEDPRVTIVETINVISTTEDAKKGTVELLQEYPQINVIATFNEWTSLGVGYAVQEMELADETRVIAFDSNVVSVGMLETGEVDGLIVQNPYAMGYLGVETAYRLINKLELDSVQVDTATTLITRDNMFQDECQKVLFTFD